MMCESSNLLPLQEPAGEGCTPWSDRTLLGTLTKMHLDQLGYSLNDLKNLLLFRGEADMRSAYLGIGSLQAGRMKTSKDV